MTYQCAPDLLTLKTSKFSLTNHSLCNSPINTSNSLNLDSFYPFHQIEMHIQLINAILVAQIIGKKKQAIQKITAKQLEILTVTEPASHKDIGIHIQTE
jgi:hypothetical protein